MDDGEEEKKEMEEYNVYKEKLFNSGQAIFFYLVLNDDLVPRRRVPDVPICLMTYRRKVLDNTINHETWDFTLVRYLAGLGYD